MASREAYLPGVGQSKIGQKLPRHPLLLTLDAFKEALDEAGLTVDQIDGVATYPGRMGGYLGFSPVGADDVVEAFGIKAKWRLGGMELSAQLGAIAAAVDPWATRARGRVGGLGLWAQRGAPAAAAAAVRAGHARHVMCFRTVYEAAAMARPDEYPMAKRGRVDGFSQWTAPFNASSAVTWVAQYAMRHVKKYGLTREQLAQISLTP